MNAELIFIWPSCISAALSSVGTLWSTRFVKRFKSKAHNDHSSDECTSPKALSDFIAEELPDEQRERVQTHWQRCSVCRERVERVYQGLIRALMEEAAQSSQSMELGEIEVSRQSPDRLFPEKFSGAIESAENREM